MGDGKLRKNMQNQKWKLIGNVEWGMNFQFFELKLLQIQTHKKSEQITQTFLKFSLLELQL